MPYDTRLLEMTPDGQFRKRPGLPMSTRIIAGAVVIAAVTGLLAFAALALWLALALIPVAIAAVVVVVATIRFKMWQARRRAASFRGQGTVIRRP